MMSIRRHIRQWVFWEIRRHNQTKATTYKSFHCTEVFCCLNVHPFILLCTVVFPYYESSLIVFSWWVFREYMKTPTSLLQVIPLYISKLLSKCTSIHCSLHPCLPLLWIISDCLLMMSIQSYMKTPTSLLQVIPLYIRKLLSKCTSIHSSLHPCLPLLWIISDCLLMMSIRRHTQTTATTYKSFHYTEVFFWDSIRRHNQTKATTYKSFHCTEVFCFLNVHPFIVLCTVVFPYYVISDCLLMMSIQRNMKTPTSLLQVIQLYISKLLSKCTSIHSSLHPCLPLLWIISDCLLMMSIRRLRGYYYRFHCKCSVF